ncbi:MAG TPA: pantothenate kinase [bacterium]|nr:pantothenate kinase [bacterium]HQG47012.1 pantothenate kinase [bacterium]HQI49403.1 pantothenate kinase [bacterium]HQJ64072.1 pantothenate kinase [bacterium]
MIVGIDIGSTTTKAVAMAADGILCRLKTRAIDAITSATGIIGKLTLEKEVQIREIERIIITGVGASKIHGDIFAIPTSKVDEITAIGQGALFLQQRERVLIANIGTGTAFIEATKERITHLGGTGIGGGTIIGLSKALLKTTDFAHIMKLAGKGELRQVDLLIGDITDARISFLNKEATAANFGKMLDTAHPEDIALGLINLTYQVIGMLAVFAAQGKGYDMVVVTGNGSNNRIGQNILGEISRLYPVSFEYPADAEYATAIGAALS